jgi:hypothetical protein
MTLSIERVKRTLIIVNNETTTLYRPVGPKELALIAASGYRAFPPRLPEQPIFYPVLNETYAADISKCLRSRERRQPNENHTLLPIE